MLNRKTQKRKSRSVNKKIITILSFVNVKTEVTTLISNFSYMANATKKNVMSTEEDINIKHKTNRLLRNLHHSECGTERETREAGHINPNQQFSGNLQNSEKDCQW